MRIHEPLRRFLVFSFSTFLTLIFFPGLIFSQIAGHPTQIESDMRFRDWTLDQLKRQKAMTPAEQKLAYGQLNKDFTDLQERNNDLIVLRTAAGLPDYHVVAQKAAEINKLAVRLTVNLKLPENESAPKAAQPETGDVNLSAVLTILDDTIYQFIKNPMFKNVDFINIKDAKSAKDSLDRILLLSERARRKADSLGKSQAYLKR